MKPFLEVMMEVKNAEPEDLKREYREELKKTGRTFKITIEGDGIETVSLSGIPALMIFTAPDGTLKGGGTTSLIGSRELLLALGCIIPELIDSRMGEGTWKFIEEIRRAKDLAEVL